MKTECLMKIVFLLLAIVLLETNFAEADDLSPVTSKKIPRHTPVRLAEKGEPKAAISVMTGRNKALKIAVNELQECIKVATGAELPIKQGTIPDGPAIVIGACDRAAAHGVKTNGLKPEGFQIKTAENRVFIVGNGASGTAWGVFEFLERFVGVRWYWPKNRGGRSIPETKNLTIGPTWITDSPVFRMRMMWPPFGDSPYHEKRQHLTRFQTKLRAGNSWPQRLVVHGDSRISKVEEYRKNDEMWQMTKTGDREYTHPCYSSEGAVDAFMNEIRRHYEEGKKARLGIRGDTVTVSPSDVGISCRCEKCQELWDDDAGQYGTASEIMSRFVARLGRRMQKEFPDKTLLFLPYQNYTLPPKGVDFPDNVYVQICHMPGLALYKEPDLRQRWQGYIDGWFKLTGHRIKDWHYSCWPADRTRAPYQYYHTVNNYYRRNRDKTVGSFINGNANHWPRFHVTLYCWMKSLWDPDFDVDAAVDEYCRRMYGDASGTVREIVRIMTEGWEDTNWPGTSFSPKGMYRQSYPKETLNRIKKLLAKARKQVDGDQQASERLEYFAAPYAVMFEEYAMVIEGKGKQPLIVQKVAENPQVDGKLDEKTWEKGPAAELVTRRNDQEVEPEYATKVKGVFTLDGITFGIHMEEPQSDKLATGKGSPDTGVLWHNDCVEIFLDPPNDDMPEFYQWIISAGLKIYDARGSDQTWDAEGVKVAKHVGKDFWSLEVFIPLSVIKNVDRLGTTEWTGQITRHRHGRGKDGPGENQRLNFESGRRNASRADFCPIKFRE
ncbi:MAG: DUF4838 domain-containing protein [Planctomycetes bacterium]|nr:DUF4838 domain-containing protein [Planctomycetota bacterium]